MHDGTGTELVGDRDLFGGRAMTAGRILGRYDQTTVLAARLLYWLGRGVGRRDFRGRSVRTRLDGITAVIPADEVSLRQTVLCGHYEHDVERFIDEHVRPGDIAIDAGANIGLHSLRMARAVGAHGQVFSFEPAPGPAAHLVSSLAANSWQDRVTLRNVALTDAPGPVTLHTESGGAGLTSSLRATAELPVALEVSGSTLDAEVVPHLDRRPRLLKIDVEGAEDAVLRGGALLFERWPPEFLIVEVGSGRDNPALLAQIGVLGYEQMNAVPLAQPGEWYVNAFFRRAT